MSIYSIALFLHIVGALGLSVALGLEWVGLRQIRNAVLLEHVRPWMGILKSANKVGFLSMLATVITGVYLMLTVWGWAPWIVVTIGALVLMIALTRILTAPRMKALVQSPVSANDPFLWISAQTRIVIILGIVFLKIARPDLGGSLLVIGIAIVLGAASALPMVRNMRLQVRSLD